MTYRVTLSAALAVLCVSLAGCDPFTSPQSLFDEYLDRSARVLDVDAVTSNVPTAPLLPRRRERVRPLPSMDVGMLDFLSLYGCELQHVVGERNSIMGKVMHPGSLLEYELRFVRAAEECADEIDSERLRGRLAEVVEIKREALPDVAWNAIWGSEEIEHLLTRSRGPLDVGHDRDLAGAMASDLATLTEIVDAIGKGRTDLDIAALDAMYQRWQSRALAGQAVRGALLAATRLDDASRIVEARLGERPVCVAPEHRPRAAENMRGMFMTVFVGHVQPYLADLTRVRREIVEPLSRLADIGKAAQSPAVVAYAERALRDARDDSVWASFDAAVARHVEAWQALLEQCGMRPGQEASPD
ncbi:MAG: DUF3080 domain-containing protein [Azoarcus sp.]|nr:DUF3080 domain-containing protein [Azoarcus sp.]